MNVSRRIPACAVVACLVLVLILVIEKISIENGIIDNVKRLAASARP